MPSAISDMSFQTILQLVAMIGVLTCIGALVAGALRLTAADFADLLRKINRQPILGPLLRTSFVVAVVSVALEAAIRIGKAL